MHTLRLESPAPQSPASEQIVYLYGDNPVRLVRDEQENPWFVAKDICRCLGLNNVSHAVKGNEKAGAIGLDEEEIDDITIRDTIGRLQKTLCVNESGMYALIFKSRKEEAREFRKWVTSVVLPQIRKTGSYQSGEQDALAQLPEEMRSRLLMARQLKDMGYDPQQSTALILGKVNSARASSSHEPDPAQAEALLCAIFESILACGTPSSHAFRVWMMADSQEAAFLPPETTGAVPVIILRLTALHALLPEINTSSYSRIFRRHPWFLTTNRPPRAWRLFRSTCWLIRQDILPEKAAALAAKLPSIQSVQSA